MAFRRLKTLAARFLQWPLGLRLGVIVAAFALFAVATWKGYETYDYIEHDNDFCQSCHLMQEPFRRFEASGHRGLSCKACHKPNLIERSKMALTQVVENPDEISHHARVPNEKCAHCHIEGDPERWKQIAQTAGHRVHLESDQLEGLQCVQCHSAAIHEFVPLDRTCGQSDCHPTVRVQLGKMANENELHCVSCHDFLAEPGQRIGPRQEDCMQCHAMRERLQSFQVADDPHRGNCRDCHNAHTHQQPADAVESCLNAGCHGEFLSDPTTMPALHRGLPDASFRDCLQCHSAHSWTPPATECVACHGDLRAGQALAGQQFDHARHARLDCVACHDGEHSHGSLKMEGALDCMGCHHDARSSFSSCQRCHDAAELAAPIAMTISMRFTAPNSEHTRQIGFEHARHAELDCASCHDGATLISAHPRNVTAQCADCHADHHEFGSNCASCHQADLLAQHDRSAHVGCSGANCHAQSSVARIAQVEDRCLLCHGDQAEHEPGSDCRSCHFPGMSRP